MRACVMLQVGAWFARALRLGGGDVGELGAPSTKTGALRVWPDGGEGKGVPGRLAGSTGRRPGGVGAGAAGGVGVGQCDVCHLPRHHIPPISPQFAFRYKHHRKKPTCLQQSASEPHRSDPFPKICYKISAISGTPEHHLFSADFCDLQSDSLKVEHHLDGTLEKRYSPRRRAIGNTRRRRSRMFTVKYVDGDGVENIAECRAVIADRIPSLGERNIATQRRVLIFDETPTDAMDNNVGVYTDNGCRSSNGSPEGPVVYVMNRFGSTVATYRL